MKCRHCAYELDYTFLDLGFAPPSNAYLSKKDLIKMERDQVLEFVNLKRQVLFIKGNGEMINHKEMEFSLLYRMKLLKLDLKALK